MRPLAALPQPQVPQRMPQRTLPVSSSVTCMVRECADILFEKKCCLRARHFVWVTTVALCIVIFVLLLYEAGFGSLLIVKIACAFFKGCSH